MDPILVASFVGFASNVASDLVHDGVGWLARTLRRVDDAAVPYDTSRLNLSLQAALAESGVGVEAAIKTADFVLKRANLSYLLLLADSANQVQVEVQRIHYLERFRDELRAHLVLEAGLPANGDDLNGVVDCLSLLLERGATSLVAKATRAPLEESAARPSALFLFRNAEDRSKVFGALGQPDLSAYLQYTQLYNAAAENRYGEIQLQHLGTNSPAVPIDSIYVQPTFRPFDASGSRPEAPTVLGMRQALSAAARKVFLGPAGIGKSTFVRFTAGRIASMGNDGHIAPFVVELRRMKARPESGLFVDYIKESVATLVQVEPPDGWLEYLLVTGRAVIFFDGFDEVLDLGDRAQVRDAVRAFARLYVACDLIVTSRINGYEAAPFPPSEFGCFEVSNFDPNQVRRYAEKWFAQRSQGLGSTVDVEPFVEESRRYAAELRQNPLMLSLLCNVYYYRGDIPRSLNELYERCAAMMFQEWDAIRGIKELGAWAVNLRPALFHLALSILNNFSYRGVGIPRSDIERELRHYWQRESIMEPDQAADEARRVVGLWTGRAWIITAVGADAHNQPLFGFVHQSFLEYFAATALSRGSDSPFALLQELQPRILLLNGWSVAQMAVSVFDSAHDQGGSRFTELVLESLPNLLRTYRVNMLRFAIELVGIVPMARPVEQAIVRAMLDVFADSVLRPLPGMNLAALHRESRHIHSRVDEELFSDEDSDEFDFSNDLVPSAQGEGDDFALSTLDTEVLVEGVIAACANSEARLNLVLATISDWEPSTSADQAMVAVTFVARLLVDAKPKMSDRVQSVLAAVAERLSIGNTDWLFFAACLAGRTAGNLYPELQMPWNTQVARDSITLSFIADVDVPSVLDDRVFELFSDPARLPHLQALGASFLDLENHHVAWDPVNYDDLSQIALIDQAHVGVIDTSHWGTEGYVGAFVILALYLEIFDVEATWSMIGEAREGFIGEMIRAMKGEIDPSHLEETWAPSEVAMLISRWTSGALRLTSQQARAPRWD